MDQDIREMLRDRADDVVAAPALRPATISRARRRRGMTVLTAALSVAVLISGGVVVATRLSGSARPVRPDVPRVHASLSVPIPSGPETLGVGFGSVWIAADDSIFRVDRISGRITARLRYPTAGFPRPATGQSLAIGAKDVWVLLDADGARTTAGPIQTSEATTNPDGTTTVHAGASIAISPPPPGFKRWWALFHVDPATGRAKLGPKNFGTSPASISVGPSGIWVGVTDLVEGFKGSLERFDPATGRRTATIAIVGPGRPIAIDASTNNVLALVQTPGDLPNHVVRLDINHGSIATDVQVQGAYELEVLRGQAWVLDRGRTRTSVVRLTLPDLVVAGRTRIPLDTSNFGADFSVTEPVVWVLGQFPHELFWFDPTTMRLVRRTDLGFYAQLIVADEGSVWVAQNANNSGTLLRVTIGDVLTAR